MTSHETALAAARTVDPSFANALSDSEVRIWINACNHEPARQTLRQLLAYRIRGVSAPLAALPADDLVEELRDFAEMPLEGGSSDALIETFSVLASAAAAALTASRAEVERLNAKLAVIDPAADSFHKRTDAAEARVAELLEALEPFASRAAAYETVDQKYSREDWSPQLVAAFRRARAALVKP